jgi:hypothetical protein
MLLRRRPGFRTRLSLAWCGSVRCAAPTLPASWRTTVARLSASAFTRPGTVRATATAIRTGLRLCRPSRGRAAALSGSTAMGSALWRCPAAAMRGTARRTAFRAALGKTRCVAERGEKRQR